MKTLAFVFIGLFSVLIIFIWGFNWGKVVERAETINDIDTTISFSIKEYERIDRIRPANRIKHDSILLKQNWWLGYRTALRHEKQKLLDRNEKVPAMSH